MRNTKYVPVSPVGLFPIMDRKPQETGSNTIFIALVIIFVLSILTMIVLQSPFTSSLLVRSGFISVDEVTPPAGPTPAPAVRPLVDTDVTSKITLRSPALGFTLQYPAGWRKRESTLDVVIAPSPDGLAPEERPESALWIGIPADELTTPADLLQAISAQFSPVSSRPGTVTIGGKRWTSLQIRFAAPDLGGDRQATIATTSQNEVSYFLVAIAPVAQWEAVQPTFQQILDSFEFTQQAVLRPTDATPPPTPTPTPTPVVYVVQPGDTLMGIAIRYDVDMDALASRNGINDPRRLRSGQELIIPIRR